MGLSLDASSLKVLKSIGSRRVMPGSRLNICILVEIFDDAVVDYVKSIPTSRLGLVRGCRMNVDFFVLANK